MELKYLVVGTGRCGTVYAARLLGVLGVACGHESVFTNLGLAEAIRRLEGRSMVWNSLRGTESGLPGGRWPVSSSGLVAESSYMAAPFLDLGFLAKTKVAHLVRDPLQVVNSFVGGLGYFRSREPVWDHPAEGVSRCGFHEFIYAHVPELRDKMSPLSRACLYYVRWNELIERARPGTPRCRIEDCPGGLLEALGVGGTPGPGAPRGDENASVRQRPPAELKDIPAGPVKKAFLATAERYGYKLASGKVM